MNPITTNKGDKIDHRLKIVRRRCNVAEALADGQCGGTYYEACILISSIISGLAAETWPGRNIDRKRFIETWVRFADSSLIPSPLLISTPILFEDLKKSGKNQQANLIKAKYPEIFGNSSQDRVITSINCDTSEAILNKICPMPKIRYYSYPNIFYEHARSHLIHEYNLSKSVTTGVGLDDEENSNVGIRYENILDLNGIRRQIHFSIPWLLKIIQSIAANMSNISESFPLEQPALWWIESESVK